MVIMGFYEHNSLGKFNAEIKSDLPSLGKPVELILMYARRMVN